ncbi:zinc finger protein 62 homolog [Anabas testudineus]|uniref:zinc finger protein 62 homolog n=1 Tax=Anabas testudineus TaxID=64144 RepID=UPI000E463B32|nr:zinc finger protein 62 homolog [Anabas testudineus]
MSTPLLLRAFVNERLNAAAEEIFQVFEGTIAKYEEEASSCKQEVERLRGLVLEFVSNQRKTTDVSLSSTCKEETLPEQCHSEPEPCFSIDQMDPEPRHIKEEGPDLCVSLQQNEGQFPGLKDTDVSYLSNSSVWGKNEEEDTKRTFPAQTDNCESEEFQKTKIVQFVLPLASSPSSRTQIQTERICSVRESETFTLNQTQTEQNQRSLVTRECSELSDFNAVASDYQCYLCNKSFSLTHHLVNHAFRMHSKDAGVLCAVCGKTLESSDSLNTHLKSHKSSKCCHVCGKLYKSTTSLTDHMASHAGVKLHRCHVCGKECSRKGDLKIHMRIHTGEKPFCCSYCRKSFTHSGHLKKHMRSHTGERPHRCEICGRGFLQSTHLKYHLGTHS